MTQEAQTPALPSATHETRRAGDIPVAHTPPGGFGATFPGPVLAGCSEPLVAGAPDLRGLWQGSQVSRSSKPLAARARRPRRVSPSFGVETVTGMAC